MSWSLIVSSRSSLRMWLLMKIVFPNKSASEDEIKWLLKFAIEGRKRVKDQLLRIDETFAAVKFSFTDKEGNETTVRTLEEGLYPDIYYGCEPDGESSGSGESGLPEPKPQVVPDSIPSSEAKPKEVKKLVQQENAIVPVADADPGTIKKN